MFDIFYFWESIIYYFVNANLYQNIYRLNDFNSVLIFGLVYTINRV